MTPDNAADLLALLAKLNRTIDAQQQQIDALAAEIARLTAEKPATGPTPFRMEDVVLDSADGGSS